ncbi:hypothetical protein LJK87_30155 [Paenibacillus sp. P25]|nr:hypothetical protein LJK87_30155 [Paenibacillus sp. P25]
MRAWKTAVTDEPPGSVSPWRMRLTAYFSVPDTTHATKGGAGYNHPVFIFTPLSVMRVQ